MRKEKDSPTIFPNIFTDAFKHIVAIEVLPLSTAVLLLFPALSAAQQSSLPTGRIERQVNALMADHIETKEEVHVQKLMDANDRADLAVAESLMYPADELYGSIWENRYVNPFLKRSITLPERYEVDCSGFVLPVDRVSISSRFGPRRRRMHSGIDLRLATGDTVRVAFDGKVRIRGFERRGYGHYLVIRHPNGLETVYGHLSKVFAGENDIVRAGTPIALGGRTGRATGSHLHFETRFMGQAINPEAIIDFENGAPHNDIYVYRSPIARVKEGVASASDPVYHRLRDGDTLSAVARRYGTTVARLCELNGIRTTTILRAGRMLLVAGS
ncbi:MAG: peptidoglycan DD-metalloendopeptidase family protein [Tannerellaceae bacterium]|jgi:murein DD-endopeptidase MepM/ murein hydrolase activator NlpD|nr:peptidoglycan DD-metalloendopeptidase family protein [Tannerellaceae bacterium]